MDANRAKLHDVWRLYADRNTPKTTTVILADQSAPRPPKPFITVKLIAGPSSSGMDDFRPVDPVDPLNSKHTISGMRQFTVSYQAFGVGAHDDLDLLHTLLQNPDEIITLRDEADIAIVNRGPVTDLTALIATSFENRAGLDIIFNTSRNVEVDPGVIDKTTISGKIKDAEGNETIVGPFDVERP